MTSCKILSESWGQWFGNDENNTAIGLAVINALLDDVDFYHERDQLTALDEGASLGRDDVVVAITSRASPLSKRVPLS